MAVEEQSVKRALSDPSTLESIIYRANLQKAAITVSVEARDKHSLRHCVLWRLNPISIHDDLMFLQSKCDALVVCRPDHLKDVSGSLTSVGSLG